jgi:hypothetical protein
MPPLWARLGAEWVDQEGRKAATAWKGGGSNRESYAVLLSRWRVFKRHEGVKISGDRLQTVWQEQSKTVCYRWGMPLRLFLILIIVLPV